MPKPNSTTAANPTNGTEQPTTRTDQQPVQLQPMNRRTPWETLGLKPRQEEYARLRVANPDLSGVAIVRMIEGYASRSAKGKVNAAHQLRHNPAVQQRIRQLAREAVVAVERRKRYKLSAKNVLRTLASLAFTDMRDLVTVNSDGRVTVKPTDEWPDRAAAAVAAVTNGADGAKLQLWDKPTALAKLAKVLRLIPDDPAAAPGGVHVGRAVIYIPSNGRKLLSPGVAELDAAPDPIETRPAQEEQC